MKIDEFSRIFSYPMENLVSDLNLIFEDTEFSGRYDDTKSLRGTGCPEFGPEVRFYVVY